MRKEREIDWSSVNVNSLRDTKVLLVEPPNQYSPKMHRRPNGSLGPVCLGGALSNEGFQVDYLDATVGTPEQNVDEVFFRDTGVNEKNLVYVGMNDEEIRKAVEGYDVVAVTNIFTPQTNTTLRLGHLIKEVNPEALTVVGGGNAKSFSDKMLDVFDAVGVGAGEELIVDLVAAVARREEWRNVSGLLYRMDGQTRSSGPSRVIANLDTVAKPKFDLWPLKKYWEISAPHGGDFPPGTQIKYASMETSRGCVFDCSYCHISGLKDSESGGNLQLKSLDTVMTEVQELKRLGVEWLFFEDDSLLTKPERAMRIFKEIGQEDMNLAGMNGVNLVHFFKRDNRGKLVVNRKLLEVMVGAGFRQLVLPFESGSQRLIDKYASGKWNIDKMDVFKLVEVANELGLKVPGNFMIGFPDETAEELQMTLDLAKRLTQNGLTYASFFIVTPFPGSRLHHEAVAKGYLDADMDPDMFHWGNPVMKNLSTSAEELIRLRREMWKEVNDSKYVHGKLERQVVPEPLEK